MADDLDEQSVSKIAAPLRKACWFSIIQQALVFLIAGLLLHGGILFQVSLIAQIVFWLWFMFLVYLRGEKPTHLDLIFVRWGYPAVWVAVLYIGLSIAKLRST